MARVFLLVGFLALSLVLGACSSSVTPLDVSGDWTGSYTITESTVPDVIAGTEENIDVSVVATTDKATLTIKNPNEEGIDTVIIATRKGNTVTANETLFETAGSLDGKFGSTTSFSGSGKATRSDGTFSFTVSLTKK